MRIFEPIHSHKSLDPTYKDKSVSAGVGNNNFRAASFAFKF